MIDGHPHGARFQAAAFRHHARIEAYYITAIAAGGANTPLRVAGVGRSVDELVRLNGQWLIKSRNVAPQD